MTKATRRRLLALAVTFVFVFGLPAEIDSARWWHSPRFVAELKLSRAQQSAIERVFQSTLSERRATAQHAQNAHVRLQRLLETDASDQALERAVEVKGHQHVRRDEVCERREVSLGENVLHEAVHATVADRI